MLRNCNNCVHATRDGGCSAWCCHGTETIEDVKAKAVREFAEWMYSVEYHGRDADMEERKNNTIRRWIEDFEKEQK